MLSFQNKPLFRFVLMCRKEWREMYPVPLQISIYSWLSLSRTRLSRITAYLEVKILSLLKHENLTTGKKNYCGKEEKWAISPLFHNIFDILALSSRVQLHIYLLNVVNRISFFPNSANVICRSTDTSKYFRDSLGIRDNESRLYM